MAGYTQLSTGIYGEPILAGSQTIAGALGLLFAGAASGLLVCCAAKDVIAINSNPIPTTANNIPVSANRRLLAFIILRTYDFDSQRRYGISESGVRQLCRVPSSSGNQSARLRSVFRAGFAPLTHRRESQSGEKSKAYGPLGHSTLPWRQGS